MRKTKAVDGVWMDGHLRGILGESEGAYILGMSFVHGSSPSVFSGIVLIIPGGQLQVGVGALGLRRATQVWVFLTNRCGMLSSGK